MKKQAVYRPPYHIGRTTRLIIMFTLIGIFFVVSPALILYTAGYRYDFIQGRVLTTGVLSIDVEPQDARVFIDGISLEERMPIRRTNLAPNTSYLVRIEHEGLRPWEKELFVASNQTAYVRNITLLKKPAVTAHGFPPTYEPVTIDPTGAYAIVSSDDEVGTILSRYELETGQIDTLLRILPQEEYLYTWAPEQSHILFTISGVSQTEYTFFNLTDLAEQRTIILDTAEQVQIQWSQDNDALYVQRDDVIEQWSFDDRGRIGTTTSSVWYVDDNRTLWTGGHSLSRGLTPISDAPISDHILFAKNDLVILAREAHLHVGIRSGNTWSFESIAATSIARHPFSKGWLAWSPWEFWHIDEDGNIELFNRTGNAIQDIIVIDEHGLLLLVGTDTLETFDPSYFLTGTFLDNRLDIEDIHVDKKARKVRFLGFVDGDYGLWEVAY